MAQNNSEEIDLGMIFSKIRQVYHNLLISLYKGFKFLLRSWWIFLLLIVGGVFLGYFLDKGSKKLKETTLYVQINFDATNYIYDAIEGLNGKIINKDDVFLNNHGLYKDDESLIKSIEIEPIVSISDILEKIDQDNKNVETFLEQAQYEENLLTSEIFISNYKTHKIEIKTSANANRETLDLLLDYLNENKIINEIKAITINSNKRKIEQNNLNIIYMDSIAEALGSSKKQASNASQIYFNSVDNNLNNIHLLFREIDENLKDNEKLQIELLQYNNIVELLNKPLLQHKKSFFDSKTIILPIILIVVFLLIMVFKKIYLKSKRLSESHKAN